LNFGFKLTNPILMISGAVLKAVFSIVDVPLSLKVCPFIRQENEKLACAEAPAVQHAKRKARKFFFEQWVFESIKLAFVLTKLAFP
jgi:hypothetical protein